MTEDDFSTYAYYTGRQVWEAILQDRRDQLRVSPDAQPADKADDDASQQGEPA